MELRHLRYFIGVVETGSFTAAAEHLHTAQPSLSRQIRDLEAYVGTTLLTRTSRHLELTNAGRVFLDEARLTLAQAEGFYPISTDGLKRADKLHITFACNWL
ncbi:LysR family hca operon transcriptional activator [Pseudomonas duriflava]|uniref:LysR family hca operon transcriptional activator n=1 Tax=Pseudomonas duriflava TaxID=459528 RepID=A0A562PLX7_9PSED|nr:LysR family transcriptional regulator [Pseudomonas duriflava]TWI45200.1 LysR family hca operon transcriptional activator [Pseudomonas duriflava]